MGASANVKEGSAAAVPRELYTSFFDLVEDMRDLIVFNHLCLSARFALALTCKQLRHRYWSYKNGEISSWKIVDECASNGYVSLLEVAIAHRCCQVDNRVLELAVRNDHLETVEFLYSIIAFDSRYNFYQFRKFEELAARTGNRAYLRLFRQSAFDNVDVVLAALEGGHVDFAFDIKQKLRIHMKSWDGTALVRSAARGGSLENAFLVCFYPNNPSHDESVEILHGGCEGGHLDIIKWGLENDLTPTLDDFTCAKVISNFEIFSFLAKRFHTSAHFWDRQVLSGACEYPNLRVMRTLLDTYNMTLGQQHLLTLLQVFSNREKEEDEEAALRRFECVKFLVEERGMTLPAFTRSVPSWLSFERFLYADSHSVPHGYSDEMLTNYIASRATAELDFVDFFLERGSSLACLYLCVFLTNSIQVLKLIGEKRGPDYNGADRAKTIMYALMDTYALTHGVTPSLRLSQDRSRLPFRKVSAALLWLKKEGFTVNEDARQTLLQDFQHVEDLESLLQ